MTEAETYAQQLDVLNSCALQFHSTVSIDNGIHFVICQLAGALDDPFADPRPLLIDRPGLRVDLEDDTNRISLLTRAQ